jgi:polyhydroxyalkanoate synthase
MLEDLDRGKGRLSIRMTDLDAFEVGKNIATTPGSVVYQNEMMQLIQYAPTTKTAYTKPLLIIPPWINKFYILDLQPKNSFIKYAVDRGYTVFVISWVNPDETLRYKRFEDYAHDGIFEALDAIEKATGQRQVNAIGYCIGGTLLAATLSLMKSRGDDRIQSATFFTAQVDFSEAGELRVFIDDHQLKGLEKKIKAQGYLDGESMAMTFNMLRASDLIWSFVVNNYLLGKKPATFDLLYWNSDYTRLPETMHLYYLRKMYLENKLVERGGIEMDGTPIDLRTVDIPVYIQSSREDHIAPYPSVYKATQIFSGPTTFMLAGSGHIAGVINPPAADKYGYWTNDALPPDPEDWIEGAEAHQGSWWPHWDQWLKGQSGKRIKAREPGDGDLPVIEAAPGSYVKA